MSGTVSRIPEQLRRALRSFLIEKGVLKQEELKKADRKRAPTRSRFQAIRNSLGLLTDLMQRCKQVPLAPSASPKAERRPEFRPSVRPSVRSVPTVQSHFPRDILLRRLTRI